MVRTNKRLAAFLVVARRVISLQSSASLVGRTASFCRNDQVNADADGVMVTIFATAECSGSESYFVGEVLVDPRSNSGSIHTGIG